MSKDVKMLTVERLLSAVSSEFRSALETDILNAHHHQFVFGDFFFGWHAPHDSKRSQPVLADTNAVLKASSHVRSTQDTFHQLVSELTFLPGFIEPGGGPAFPPTSFFVPESDGMRRVFDQQSAVPAHWSARVVHRRLPHRMEERTVGAYASAAISRTSPHDAVTASFAISLRNRYFARRERSAKCTKILVSQLSCRDLAAADGRCQQSDPCIRFKNPYMVHEVATTPQFQTLHPTWHETFELLIEPVDSEALNASYLTCVVTDVDIVGAPEPLGEAVLSLELVDPSGAMAFAVAAPVMRHGMLRGTLLATLRFVRTDVTR